MENAINKFFNDPDFNAWMEENIEKCPSVWKKNDTYVCEIYADYRDKLGSKQIEEILENDDPYGAFYEIIMEIYADTTSEYEYDIVKELMKIAPDDFLLPLDDNEIEDLFREWIMEKVVFELPEQHYLKQEVLVDIMVDVGDGNYDFTRNVPWEGLEDPSAIRWLMRQQGYGDSVIEACMKNPEVIEHLECPSFMKSMHEECDNLTSHMGVLTFLVSMSLDKAIELNNLITERNKGEAKSNLYHPNDRKYTDYTIISADATCGLYDPWYGAGSEMDIHLEAEVHLPVKFIDSAMPDGWRGYSVQEVYGVTSQWWEPDCVEIVRTDLPKEA